MTELRTRTPAVEPRGLGLGHRSLPRWAPWAVLAVAAAFSVGVLVAAGWSTAGFAVVLAVSFVVLLVVLSRVVEGGRKATDRLATALVTGAFLLALVPLVSVAWTVASRGAARFDVEFFTYSMSGVVGAGGGAIHAIVGTLIVTAITALISVPVGLAAAVYLVEYGHGRLARAITFLVDVMTGIPSIVAGLFSYALFVLLLGPQARLGIMGSVALSVLMVPLVVRSSEEVLKLVPNDLREASYALGVPKWLTIVKVVLRTSVAGIATGVTLAIARVIGETAPLLVTMGNTTAENFNPFSGRMASLPVFAWFSYTQPTIPPGPSIDRAWTAALLLVILVMAFNLLARLISRAFSPRTGR
jgi:phosphate transport system permease protein